MKTLILAALLLVSAGVWKKLALLDISNYTKMVHVKALRPPQLPGHQDETGYWVTDDLKTGEPGTDTVVYSYHHDYTICFQIKKSFWCDRSYEIPCNEFSAGHQQ
jgi:hypothetical protein